MKKTKRLLLFAISVIFVVSAMPIVSCASTGGSAAGVQRLTIGGIDYEMTVTDNQVTVRQLDGTTTVNSATAYLDEGYVLYRDYTSARQLTSVVYIPDEVAESTQMVVAPLALTVTAWTKDGKYIYYPTKVSILPTVYKEHTAYYQFRNMGNENTTRQLGWEKGMALTIAVTMIVSIVLAVITCGFSFAAEVAIGVAASCGASFSGGLLTKAIAPIVSVLATNYEATFVDAYGYGTGQIFHGAKITVNETRYNGYGDVFYEDYAPQLSQNFGKTAFMNTFKGNYISYPGVKQYVEL